MSNQPPETNDALNEYRGYYGITIPKEVYEAAQTLHIYFEKQMMQGWEFLSVADRRLITKFKRERDEARKYWGTESMNAAQFFGEKTKAIYERDKAREALREAREALRELWQSADAYLPACDPETLKRWRKAAGWKAAK